MRVYGHKHGDSLEWAKSSAKCKKVGHWGVVEGQRNHPDQPRQMRKPTVSYSQTPWEKVRRVNRGRYECRGVPKKERSTSTQQR